MKSKVIAVDIGASSGRVIKGELSQNILTLEEVHRFSNGIEKRGEEFCWNIEKLTEEVEEGLRDKRLKGSRSLGIDTWGVDYVLLDEEKKRIGEAIAYRDERTKGIMQKFHEEHIGSDELYARTGIQFMEFNTVYQLYAHGKNRKKELEKAKHLLFIPDYLNFHLTGETKNEYTNATTSQMINLEERDWDKKILKSLEIEHLFEEKPIEPGSVIGTLKAEISEKLELNDIKVIAPATHDTGSAVLSVPADKESRWAYISSGTWSLMGIEGKHVNSEKAREYNFTNEGGIEKTTRVLKNIMGLWLIQNVKKEFDDRYSFGELVEMAKSEREFDSLIDPNDTIFFNPKSMLGAIKEYCIQTDQRSPETPGQFSKLIFHSLAKSYANVLQELEDVTGESFDVIHIIGGGCQNEYLNQLCADYCRTKVIAGPVEGTAVGNILAQYMGLGAVKDRYEAREIVKNSFQIKEYLPER